MCALNIVKTDSTRSKSWPRQSPSTRYMWNDYECYHIHKFVTTFEFHQRKGKEFLEATEKLKEKSNTQEKMCEEFKKHLASLEDEISNNQMTIKEQANKLQTPISRMNHHP